MGYRGKTVEQQQARELRAQAWTLRDIADELGVSKSSVSTWVRDVEFEPRPRRKARKRGPNKLARQKDADIEAGLAWGRQQIGELSDRDLLIAGAALYAGEGSKTDGRVTFSNSNPAFVRLFCRWLRRFFDVDEERLRVGLYLHVGLDQAAAVDHWSRTTGIPPRQFTRPYRAVPDAGIRNSKHVFGCASVSYSCSQTHRRVMGLIYALTRVEK